MSKITNAAISLMIATMLSKGLGFIRELCLASSYGASTYSDAYLIAINIPLVIFSSIAMALGTSYIPMFCDIRQKSGEQEAIKFSNNLINIVAILCAILAIIGCIFAQPLVKVFAMGFEGETLRIATEFTRILLFGIIFIGINDIIMPFLQIKENFIIPGIVGIPYNLVIIVSIFISLKYGIKVLVYGTLFAIIAKVLFQIPFAKKKGYCYKPYINLKDENIKNLILLVAPVFVGVAVNQVNGLVDRTLASTLAEGSISALNYANKLNEFVMGLFIVSVTSVIYPMLSKLSAENNKEEFIDSIVKSVNGVMLLVLPISVGAMSLATPIVRLLFQRGAFDERATEMTAIALFFYAIGMVGFGLRDIISRVFYSIQDTKTPMINGAIAMGLNIVLNIVLVRYMKHAGLALATSISAIICIILLFRSLKKKIGYFGQDKILKVFFKSIISSIIMGAVVLVTYGMVNTIVSSSSLIGQVISLGIAVLVGIVVYGICIIVFKVEEVTDFIKMIKPKLKRNNLKEAC